MIGLLPKTLAVDDVEYPINSDFRAVLIIFEALEDKSLSQLNKRLVMLEIIFTPLPTVDEPEPQPNIPPNTKEALAQIKWFIDIGQEERKSAHPNIKTMDYKQDEHILFSAVNAVWNRDVREEPYMHWWTFYSLCQAINNESLMSNIANIRYKKARGEKLEKWESKFYSENRHLVDIKISESFYDEMVRQLRG